MRGLTVSGTKNDLIERLRNYQEQNVTTTAGLKNGIPQASQQGATSAANTSSPTTATTSDHQSGEGGFKLALSSLAQVVPGRVMRFGSTSSSPPVSPTPSERSLAGMSPDETSCNGDMFGEMVRSTCEALTNDQMSSFEPFPNIHSLFYPSGELPSDPAHPAPISSAPIKCPLALTVSIQSQRGDPELMQPFQAFTSLMSASRAPAWSSHGHHGQGPDAPGEGQTD